MLLPCPFLWRSVSLTAVLFLCLQAESVALDELGRLFLREFGYRLSPAVYGAATLRELVRHGNIPPALD